ncbi:MAG: major capsid protein [Pirellulales bacterium]
MATALPQELQPVVVAERVSRIKVINDTFQKFWGFNGDNVTPVPVRTGTIDIFNETRQIATAVVPGSASANIAPQVVGTFNYSIPEVRENENLKAEKLFNLRQMGSSANVIDVYGMNYVAEQERFMKQKLVNFREFQAAAMLRGSYTYSKIGGGTSLSHAFTGGTYTVDYQVPSANKNQLSGAIATTWLTTTNKIVDHIVAVNKLSASQSGRGIRHAFCNSTIWQLVVNNTQVQNLGGSVNQPFDYIERSDKSEDYTAKLKAIPWLTWHITDNGLDVGGSFTTYLADTQCTFTVEPGTDVASYYTCPSPVVEYDGGPIVGKQGEHYWYTSMRDPAAYQLNTVLSGMPILKIPTGIFYGTVVF